MNKYIENLWIIHNLPLTPYQKAQQIVILKSAMEY